MTAAVSSLYTVPAVPMDAPQRTVLAPVALGPSAVVRPRAHARPLLVLSVYRALPAVPSWPPRRPTAPCPR